MPTSMNSRSASIAGHLAPDHHAAVAVQHRAVGDGDVLAGAQGRSAVVGRSRFDRDAVVTDIDAAVGNAHIAARIGIDAVGVGRVGWIADGDSADGDIVASHRIERPVR